MRAKFWIVVSDGRGPASWPHRHMTEQQAFDEAKRLTTQYGGRFFVMEAVGAAEKNDIKLTRYTNDEELDIPF